MPLPYDLNAVTRDHIYGLIGEEEGYLIDFKKGMTLDAKGNPEADSRLKDEFAADVTSFANELGGDLVIGVDELREEGKTTGIATEVVGIARNAADALDRQANSVLMGRVDPRLQVKTKTIQVDDDKVVLVIRVPRSPNAPHAVRNVAHDEHSLRFFGRNRTGKYSLDVSQVRDRFVVGDSLEERIGKIVNSRIDHIISRPPLRLARKHFLVAHIIPHAALSRDGVMDLRTVLRTTSDFGPNAQGTSIDQRMNFDGCLFSGGGSSDGIERYSLVMRNGVVELVFNEGFNTHQSQHLGSTIAILVGHHVAKVIGFTHRVCQSLNQHGFEPPYYVQVTVNEVAGFYLAEAINDIEGPIKIDRPRLDFPLIELQSTPQSFEDVAKEMRPVVEAYMNAAGRNDSTFYTSEGRWKL
jgi:hypothetical protein